MTAQGKTYELMDRLQRRRMPLDFEDANLLRKAEMTLQRWGAAECGDGDDFASWSIERDEETDKPFRCIYPHDSNKVRRFSIPDREKGALRRIADLCRRLEIHFFHQTDPRGATLYVSVEPLTDQNYSTTGVSCCI